MKDPAEEVVECNSLLRRLNQALRNGHNIDVIDVIATCQALKSNLSCVEEWAFQKGKEDGRN